jgi:nucleolin
LTDRVTEDDLRKVFDECGTIQDIRFAWKDRFAKIHKGFCFVQFSNEDEAKKAVDLNGKVIDGQEIKTSPAGEGKTVRNSVFVGNLSYQTSQESLKKMFEDCGKVTKCHIPLKEDGSIVGYAFIDFEGPEDVQRALRLHDTDVDGRKIRVELGGKKGGDRGGRRGGFGGDRRDDRRGDDRRGGYERRDDRGSSSRYGGDSRSSYDSRSRGGYERRDDRDPRSSGDSRYGGYGGDSRSSYGDRSSDRRDRY